LSDALEFFEASFRYPDASDFLKYFEFLKPFRF